MSLCQALCHLVSSEAVVCAGLERAVCFRYEILQGPELGVGSQEGCSGKEKDAFSWQIPYWFSPSAAYGARGHRIKSMREWRDSIQGGLACAEDTQSLCRTQPTVTNFKIV